MSASPLLVPVKLKVNDVCPAARVTTTVGELFPKVPPARISAKIVPWVALRVMVFVPSAALGSVTVKELVVAASATVVSPPVTKIESGVNQEPIVLSYRRKG